MPYSAEKFESSVSTLFALTVRMRSYICTPIWKLQVWRRTLCHVVCQECIPVTLVGSQISELIASNKAYQAASNQQGTCSPWVPYWYTSLPTGTSGLFS